MKKKHHSEAKIYQEHTHVVKGKIKLEKASLHKETKHHKDIVKSEKAQYTGGSIDVAVRPSPTYSGH